MNRILSVQNITASLFLCCLVLSMFAPLIMHGQTVRESLDAQRNREEQAAFLQQLENDRQSTEGVGRQMSDVRPYDGLPTKDRPSTATAAADTVASCLGGLLASMAQGVFSKFVGKVGTAAGIVLHSTEVPVYMPDFSTKEVGSLGGVGPSMDGLAICLGNAVIQGISVATINWINGGFKGNPLFVDDPAWLLKDLKEDTLDAFLTDFADGILCKEFDLEIKLALRQTQKPQKDYKCTYDQISDNFSKGFFTFDDFQTVTQNPMNNRIGAFLTLDSNYQELVNSRKDAIDKQLDWNNGYFSWQDKKDPTKTVTPGKVAADLSQKVGWIPFDRLVLADEFDEITSAFINQMIRMAVPEIVEAVQ